MKYIKTFITIALLIPSISYASFVIGWNGTSTLTNFVTPNLINGVQQIISGKTFNSVSTNSYSIFPYASTTALSATTFCLTGDLPCRTTWPTGGGSIYPFTPATTFNIENQATTGIAWFQNGFNASSTSHIASTTFDISGNVGIGTTTPSYKLDIQDRNIYSMRIYDPSNTGNHGILFGTNSAEIRQTAGSGGLNLIVDSGLGNSQLYLRSGNASAGSGINIGDDTNANIKMAVGGGNVGIGTTNPNFKLEVNGTASTTNLNLPNTTASNVGVINVGGSRFIHDYNGVDSTQAGNIFIGLNSGNFTMNASTPTNTWEGAQNTGFGSNTLSGITTGWYNSAFGYGALQNLTTGSNSLAFGKSSLIYNTIGSGNTAIGSATGYNAGNNIAQYRIIDDTNMTLIGYGATKDNASTLTNGMAIGYGARVFQSNQVVLGNDSVITTLLKGNVGIGTTTPGSLLSIAGVANFASTGSTLYSKLFAPYYTATSTSVASTFPYASTTMITNGNGDMLTIPATYIVSTSTTNGHFTNIQSAINALPSGGGKIFVRAGTYTITSPILIKVANTVIEGEGPATEINFNGGSVASAIMWNGTGITNTNISNLYIHNTSGSYQGIGINASNTPIAYVRGVKIDKTATSTSMKDTVNQTFYNHFENLDLRDNKTCIDMGGTTPANDNYFESIRCAPTSGQAGFGLYSSTGGNGSQNNTFVNFEVEPTGAGTAITAIYLNNAINTAFLNPYIEGNAIGYSFTSSTQRTNFNGGLFLSNTTYTDASSAFNLQNVGKEGVTVNQLAASTSIQDVTGNDATTNSLSLKGNTNYAKTGDGINITYSNATDSGSPLHIVNPGTGASIRVDSGNSGFGTTSPWRTLDVNGTVGMKGLTTSASLQTGILCLSAKNEVINESVACVASSKRFKMDIKPLDVGINELMKLNPVSFYYKPEYNGSLQTNPNYSGQQEGFIAEEVQKVDPRLVVVETEGVDKGKPHGVRYDQITALITQAIQDVWNSLQNLIIRVTNLETKISEQQKEINQLKAILIKNNIK